MVRKGVAVWVLGSLTFLAGLHVLDGFLWITQSQGESLLLPVYPIAKFLGVVDPVFYLVFSLTAVFLLWGGTTVVALRNPIESFLGKVLEDGQKESQADVEFLGAKTSILEMMSETLHGNSELLAGLRDVVLNVRREVLSLEPVKRSVDTLKGDMEGLKKMVKCLENEVKKHKLCPACGRGVLAEFTLCSCCGENPLKPSMGSRTMMPMPLPVAKTSG